MGDISREAFSSRTADGGPELPSVRAKREVDDEVELRADPYVGRPPAVPFLARSGGDGGGGDDALDDPRGDDPRAEGEEGEQGEQADEGPAEDASPAEASGGDRDHVGAGVDLDADDETVPPLTDPFELSRVLLAVLLSSREALKPLRLAEICNTTQKAVHEALARLSDDLRDAGLPIHVSVTGERVSLLTVPAVYPYLKRLKKLRKAEKLSPAALETLAVIAYRQPVIRAEVESIRGVKAGPMLRSLLEHKLIKIVGRADVPGRPLQYGTTQTFLERFGLASLKDLPSIQEFRSLG